MDSCLLNKPISYALKKLGIDTSKISAFEEPPRILRGISFSTDSSQIRLFTGRKSTFEVLDSLSYEHYYTLLLDSAVVGISWRKPNANKKRAIGRVIWYWEH